MISLHQLFLKAGLPLPEGLPDSRVRGIAADSRKVRPGELFIALPGYQVDGSRFASEAAQRGAAVILSEHPLSGLQVPVVRMQKLRRILALLAAAYYGDPASRIEVVGITGTNGKTTISHMLEAVFQETGRRTGLVGTVHYRWPGRVVEADRTTPDILELQQMLCAMERAGVDLVVMEVSSHALVLERVAAVRFQAAVFTNLTRDHLDFHKDMDEYGAAKASLFTLLKKDGVGVINADDPACTIMQAACASRSVTVGCRNAGSDYRVGPVEAAGGNTQFLVEGRGVKEVFQTPLWGHFNIMNAACAAVTALEMGIDPGLIRKGLARVNRVPGRMEGIHSNLGFRVVVDYAHSPDALENVLTASRGFTAGRLIAVFGCGGDRDRGKRPQMGRAAAQHADLVFVTSDNPRTEDPDSIIRDILEGIPARTNCRVVADRASAIRLALGEARPGDTVVLAGKGHETYQEIMGVRRHFDDREELKTALMMKSNIV